MEECVMKKIWWRGGAALVVLLSLWGCRAQSSGPHKVLDDPQKTVQVAGTNINPVMTSKHQFYDSLITKYPQLQKSFDHDDKPETYVIPGLAQTRSVKVGTTRTLGESKKMDPQGLAVTSKYVIISAYSRDKKYNSVLYLLDKKTGGFVKQIVLPNNSHVGGLAYDTVSKRLWVTTETASGHASLSAYSQATLNKSDFAISKRPTKFDKVVTLPQIARASFLTYHNSALYVGYFDASDQGSFLTFPMTKKGLPQVTSATRTQLRGSGAHRATYSTGRQLQGASFYKGKILFSQSFGKQSSKLLTFDNDGQKQWLDFDADDTLQSVSMPPYLEQIVASGPDLYVLFESASAKYRSAQFGFHADRVLKLDLDSLLK
jgi:hypothetical protein